MNDLIPQHQRNKMPKFIKKPITVIAVKYNGSSTHASQIVNWMEGGEEPVKGFVQVRDNRPLLIETLEGTMKALPGDWIIKGINGEFYPCKPDIFEATYELAE